MLWEIGSPHFTKIHFCWSKSNFAFWVEFRLQVFSVQRVCSCCPYLKCCTAGINTWLFYSLKLMNSFVFLSSFSEITCIEFFTLWNCHSKSANYIQRMNAIDKYYMHVKCMFFFYFYKLFELQKKIRLCLGQNYNSLWCTTHFLSSEILVKWCSTRITTHIEMLLLLPITRTKT